MDSSEEIQILQEEIDKLKLELRTKEEKLNSLRFKKNVRNIDTSDLTTDEVSRYSRQMLIPQLGIIGQLALKKSKVLIVGTGGLGCPAALYLAAAGVGQITLIDNDEVELTNLHRQILHSESDLGVAKVKSAFDTLKSINSNIEVIPIHIHATSTTLSKLLHESNYDVVVDGTDNVPTRYLLNDVCVLNKIPLVSGSALQLDGQLTVYNYQNGPCYRCIFPKPPPPETVQSCGDGGVLGVVPGVIGVLQALEAIKIITWMSGVLSGRLLLFDAALSTFRNVKLRGKNPKCEICGDAPIITSPIDYEEFCQSKADDKVCNINILGKDENVDVKALFETEYDGMLLDVRPKLEYEMCCISNTMNVPYSDIQKEEGLGDLRAEIEQQSNFQELNVYVICRRGNDSQRAVLKLKEVLGNEFPSVKFINLRGGLHAYAKYVDSSFPIY